MDQAPIPPPRLDRRARIGLAVTTPFFLAVMVAILAGITWPVASASLRDLRQAYPGQNVRMLNFRTYMTTYATTTCGFFSVGTGPGRRFLEIENGLFAERTPDQWTKFPADSAFEAKWEDCEHAYYRGRSLDGIVNPIVVALLGLT